MFLRGAGMRALALALYGTTFAALAFAVQTVAGLVAALEAVNAGGMMKIA